MNKIWKARHDLKKTLKKTDTTFDPKILDAVRDELKRIDAKALHVIRENPERDGMTTARVTKLKLPHPIWMDEPRFPKFKLPTLQELKNNFNSLQENPNNKIPDRPNIAKIEIETNLDNGEVKILGFSGFKGALAIAEKYGDRVIRQYEKFDHYMVYNYAGSVFLKKLDWKIKVGDIYSKKQFDNILADIKICGMNLSACIKADKEKKAAEVKAAVQAIVDKPRTEISTIEI